ncbi:MAG: S-layer homology domain-containing protein [Oscillospiraceae bacterium]|nr:S-layer homology domain-containing protein [Oscillospiraceae bacterium]
MKRLLSLLLAITMIVSLLPIASAEEENEPQVLSNEAAGLTLVYDLNGVMVDFKNEGATLTGADSFFGEGYYAIDYDATGGFFEYAANKSKDKYSWNEDGYNYPAKVGSRQVAEAKAGTTGASGIQMLGYYRSSEGLLNNWFAIKINVPKSGKYTPKASYWKYNKDGETYLDYYLIKDTGEEISVALDETRLSIESEYYIGSKFCNDTTAAGSQRIVLNEAFENDVTLEEGEYYLVYKPRVVTVAPDYIGNYAMASNFTLDGGNTADPVPMGATVTCDSDRVFDGGDTAQLSAFVFMSDKTKKKTTDVKFVSLTPEFATIDEATGVITGVAPGEAEFEVTVTENGKEFKAYYSLPVSDNRLSGITVKYALSSLIKKLKAEGATLKGADSFFGEGFNAFSYDATNGFFEYAANLSRGKYSWNDDGYDYPASIGSRQILEAKEGASSFGGVQMLAYYKASEGEFKNWFAIKINVPKSGVYTPKASYWQYKKPGETKLDFYLIKNTGEELSVALDEARLSPTSEYYIGSKDCENPNASGSQSYTYDESFGTTVNLEEGEYYLVYKTRVITKAADYQGHYAMASDFTLDGGNIKEPAPMMARFHTDKSSIYSNGGTAKVNATVYLSDGTTVVIDDVKVTSLTPELAEVNDTFSVIIGRGLGKAKFDAEITYGGKTLSGEFEVDVTENPTKPGDGSLLYYDISTWLDNVEGEVNGSGAIGGLGYKAITYESTNGMFEYAANKTGNKYSWEDGGTDFTTYPGSSERRFRVAADSKRNGLQMYVTKKGWWALKINVPETGLYMPAATYWAYNRPGESYLDYFVIKNDGSEMSTLLNDSNLTTENSGYIGSKRNEDTSISGSASQTFVYDEPFGEPVQLEAGEYYLVYKPRSVSGSDTYGCASNFSLDGVNCLKNLIINVDTDLYTGESEEIKLFPTRLDGTVIDLSDIKVTYSTSNRNILTVDENGVVNAIGDGNATITVTVDDGSYSITRKIDFTAYDNSGVSDTILNLKEKLYVNQAILLDADAVMNSGNVIDIPEENITYEIADKAVLKYSDGVITAIEEGKTTVTVKINFRGESREYEVEVTVVPGTGKTEPTIYTYEERQNALNNAAKYSWAANTARNYAKTGDKSIEWAEAVHSQIIGEGIPRGRQIGRPGDDRYEYCRYCSVRIGGEGGLQCNFAGRPWKVQCPECKRFFPSNDFEKFLKLGLDQKGFYDVDRARQNHHEMLFHGDGSECTCEKPKTANTPEWYIFYGYGNPEGYLYNDLYPEIIKSNMDPWGDKITWNKDADGNDIGADLGTYRDPETGEVLWTGGSMWGVDDGWGYVPGRKYADDGNLEERHGYISFYVYKFWMTIYGHVKNLSEAYVYTSDPKYGRAGIILLDRIADVWPHFDSYYFKDLVLNTSGGHGAGAATGRINDHNLGRYFGYGADAFFPMINDPQVIKRLSDDAIKYGLDNPKTSSDLIWRNIADGILVANADMCMDGRINGNFGQAQSVAAIAAIALNEQPKTDEIIEWLYKPTRATSGNSPVPGGDIERKIINDVDRDGMGNEASPRYNTSWVGVLGLFADELCKYEGDMEYNPYANPKFAKMYDPQMNIMLTHSKHPNIGDAGDPASVTLNGSAAVWYNAFKKIDNEYYKKKIAQYIWYYTDGNLSQFGNNIMLKNPGGAEDELLKYIDKDASMGSIMLTGYGFAALRDGKNYKSVSASSDNNNQRDFWMWFGNTGASHAHNDALNMGIDAFGLDLAPDLGYPEDTSYTPNRLQWVNTALSHNLVVVDENGQAGSTHIHGTPMHFDDGGKVKVMDADMHEVYKQTEQYRRTIVMIEANDDVSYGIDFFRVIGGKHHLFSFHSQAENAYPVEGIELTPDPVVQDENGNDIVGSYAGADVPYGKDPWTQNTWSYETKYPRGYTWLKNVRRDNSPENQFTIEFDVQDYRKVLKDSSGIKLRLTQVNDFTPTEVAIAGGYMTQKSETKMMPETWDYVLVERDGKGEELDSLFTTVYQPYRNTPYIESIDELDVSIKSGSENSGDMARAVKVKHTAENGGKTDYVVYATNKNVVYTITDGEFSFDFRGFVGVYTLNANGGIIYRYVNDGDIIGEETGKVSEYTGTVVDFQKENAFENYIDVEIDCTDLADLSEKYIYVNNDGVENGVYRIASATDEAEGLRDGCVRLDLETVTLIRGHIDEQDLDKGYEYNIKEGQTFRIPTSFVDESVPEFKEIENNISASVGSVVTLPITAESPTGAMVTYSSNSLPRGASLDSESGVITWKPTASQIGENHVGVTARDSDGREATIHLTVTVYGSTSAGSSGGGGGGETTTPTIPSDEKENDKEPSTDVGEDIILPPAESDVRFTDLGNHAWAEDAINALADKGIIKGTSETTYSPANNITRADFALLLVRAFEKESDNTENFADVSETDYFAKELAIARNTGLVGGVGDNKFAPKENIKRCDMMLMVYRVLKAEGIELEVSDVDMADIGDVPEYALDAVKALIGVGLVNGKNNLIAPNDNTTRAEVAVLLKRVLDFIEKK